MTSPERLAQLLDGFNNRATIVKSFGLSLSFLEDRSAVIDMPYNPGLNHVRGGIHGGVLMTLLDTAGWFTSAAAHSEDVWVATSELSVHLLLPAQGTSLRAVGHIIKAGRRQDIVEAHVTDSDSRLVAHGIGTFVVLADLPLNAAGSG